MKAFLKLLIAVSISIISQAQTLPGINYQALLRNTNGQPISNQTIGLQASILHGLDSVEVFKETHTVTTNAFGQLNLSIGNGLVVFGSFNSINWGNGPYLLKTAVDLTGSGTFLDLEVVKFYSVPFAKHAERANGIPYMTYEERDAIENPIVGMQIINLTTNCLNYYLSNGWYETCGELLSLCGDPITDSRDGKQYQTKQIGDQCWMVQNINIGTRINGNLTPTNNGIIEKYCYNNTETNCDVYGGLYTWDEMMQYSTTAGGKGICPNGWHLPTDGEWASLIAFLGNNNVAGGKMKETGYSHWSSPNTGATNSSGFTALPGGLRYSGSGFEQINSTGCFWSSSLANSTTKYWFRILYHNSESVNRSEMDASFGFSVRCLKNN